MVKSKVVQLDDEPVPQVTSRPSKNKRKRGTDIETVSQPVAKPTPSTRTELTESLKEGYDTHGYDIGAEEALANLRLLGQTSWKGKVCCK